MPHELTRQSSRGVIRRFSSRSLSRKDLESLEPSVVVPDDDVDQHRSSIAEEIAIARSHTDHVLSDYASDNESITSAPVEEGEPVVDFSFAFDIDGVLLRGGKALPTANEALRRLNGENEYNMRAPYVFVTNGGGKTEAQRCYDLSRMLDVPVSTAQFIQGHTPMKLLTEKYKHVLVVGGVGEACRDVAEEYGFEDPITPGDLILYNKHITPYRTLTEEEQENSRGRDFSQVNIEAILVFADSRDWAGDQQIILDLLLSKNGRIGTKSETGKEGPAIYFAHSDFVWSTPYDQTRFGMGALRLCIEALYRESTGQELETNKFGKPNPATFEYANKILTQWRRDMFGKDEPPKRIYFVGDTEESDIKGANAYNEIDKRSEWISVLVKTGVWDENVKPKVEPKHISDNVLDAVNWAIQREHEMSHPASNRAIPDGHENMDVILE